MKSITIFTEGFPVRRGETFFEKELTYIEKAFDTVLIIPMGLSEPQIIWHKGEEKTINKVPSRMRLLLKQHWRLLWNILKSEWKSTGNSIYIRKPLKFFKMLMYALKRAEQLHNQIPESTVLYSYWYANWTLSLSMLKHIYRPKTKWVTRMHGYDVDLQQVDEGYYPFRKWNNQYLNTCVFISNYGRQLFKEHNPDFKGNLELSYLGIDEKPLARLPTGSAFVVVSCSNILPVKRLDKMASILSYLDRKVIWLHFGEGTEYDNLLKWASRLPDNIGFQAKGYVSNEDLMKYYQYNEIDLFLNTSKLEGVPYSMIEAGAHGIPLGGFNICGIPELVSKNMGVLMDEEISNKENAEKIKSFFISKSSRDSEYRANIKREVLGKFLAEANYTALQNILLNHINLN